MSKLVVVDAGIGNVGSVANMCRRVGADPIVSGEPQVVAVADKVILPGVGAFDHAMCRLEEHGLADALHHCYQAGADVFGICLGMHLLLESSEEGESAGLSLIAGRVRRLPSETSVGSVPVPHMGWSKLKARSHPLMTGLADDARFYFVHSYAAEPACQDDAIAHTVYGDPFVSAVARDRVVGVQFHPEKSHRHGKALLQAFIGWR